MFEEKKEEGGGGGSFWPAIWLSPEHAQGEKPGKECGGVVEISGHDDLAKEHVIGRTYWTAAHGHTFESVFWTAGPLSRFNGDTCKKERESESKPPVLAAWRGIQEGFRGLRDNFYP